MAPNVDTKDWSKNLETVEEYIRVFQRLYGLTLSYRLMDDLEPPAAASDLTHRSNGSEYFTHNVEMTTLGLILRVPAVFGSDPEAVLRFTYLLIKYRELIWDKMVEIFQGSDAWKYMNPAKKYRDKRMGYKIRYNHYLVPSNI